MAPRTWRRAIRTRRLPARRRHSPTLSDVASRSSRCGLLLQHRTDEGHRKAPLREERRRVKRIEQVVERAHIAREAPLQVARGLLRQLKAAQVRAQPERLALFALIERAQLKDRTRRKAR